ncbi:hypothetical protein IAU59_001136 [Kwoniella sp. CBS 9459]
MSNWPWNHLDQYCADPTQRAWVEQQLRISPIAPGQSPEDWLLYRSMIAEGQTEAEAWLNAHLFRQNGDTGAFLSQQDFSGQHQPTPPLAHLSPPSHSYGLNDTVFQQTNGFYQEHGQYIQQRQPQQQQPISSAPYGFVNLQEIAPIQRSYQAPAPNPQQQPLAPYLPPQVIHDQQPIPGPSIVRPGGHHPQPATIHPAELHGDHVRDAKPPALDIKPEVVINTPFRLAPPNSSRTPSPKALTPFSVQTATGRKRALSPLTSQIKNGVSHVQQKKAKKNSSSFDPPSPPGGDNPAGSIKGKGRSEVSPAASAGTPRVTMETLRPLLAPGALKEPRPVPLFKNLRERTVKGKEMDPLFEPNPRELREIAIQLRDYASTEYLREMADDHRYCEVWERWLNKMKADVERWEPAIAPVLQVLARTDMPVDYIRDIKFRAKTKTIANLAQERNLAHKGAIQTAYLRYKDYVENTLFPANRLSAEYLDEQAEEARNNKRKIDAVGQDDGKPGPSKVPTPTTTTKPGPSVNAASASAKRSTSSKSATDMSFFGAESSGGMAKPKAKIPDIKKVDRASIPPRPSVPTTNSASGLLASTLSSLTRNVGGSTPVNTSGQSRGSTPDHEKKDTKPPRYNAKGKLIRNVRFKDVVREEDGGGTLVQVRTFKEEAWEFETPTWEEDLSASEEEAFAVNPHGQTAQDMNKAEGAVLAKQWGHELIDWYEPTPYWDVPDDHPPITPEATAQTQREHGILAIAYPPGIPVPDPTESGVRVVESDQSQMRMMDPISDSDLILQHQTRGASTHAHLHQPAAAPSAAVPQTSVSDLLKNLTGLQNIIPPTTGLSSYQPQPPAPASNEYQHSYGYSQGQGYGSQHQPQRRWGGQDSFGDRPTAPAWGGNDNYARSGYDQRESRRPQDRDLSRPVCRFWPRE